MWPAMSVLQQQQQKHWKMGWHVIVIFYRRNRVRITLLVSCTPVLFIIFSHINLTNSMEQRPSWEAKRFSASQEIPAFYGTRRFITAFTRARHLSLSWASSIQFMPIHPTSWRSILILSSHLRLGLRSGRLPSGLPTKILYAPTSHFRRDLLWDCKELTELYTLFT
jgi:hypothetical protein